MNDNFHILYIGTAAMVVMSLFLIGFVVWATGQMKDQRQFTMERDKRYLERIEAVELLVKTEFAEVLNQIKNL